MNLSSEQRAIVNEAKRIQREQRRAATKARPKSPKADRGRTKNGTYLAWLRRQPCSVARLSAVPCCGPVQAAHLRYGDQAHGRTNPGLQVKPSDQWATSLCAGHHSEQHSAGNERAWWASFGLDGSEVAVAAFAKFSRGEG
jgi:hypothetical protein